MFSGEETDEIIQRMTFLLEKGYTVDKGDYAVKFKRGDITVSVISGKYDEHSNIVICQPHYYDFSGVKSESKRKLLMFFPGCIKEWRLGEIIRKKNRHDIYDLDKMERIRVLADYLEDNMEKILTKRPPFIYRKYHHDECV